MTPKDLSTLIQQHTGHMAVPSHETYLPLDLHLQRLLLPNNEGKVLYHYEGETLVALNFAGLGLAQKHLVFLEQPEFSSLLCLNLYQNQLEGWKHPQHMAELVYLDLSENAHLGYVHIEGPLPKLKRLDVSKCGLSTFELGEGYGHLEFLDVGYNKGLTQLTFSSAFPQLTYLYLPACGLQRLSFRQGMPKLGFIFAYDNQIEAFHLAPGTIFPRLESLELSNNQLKELGKDFLIPFPALLDLNLVNNPLEESILSNIGETPSKDLAFIRRYTQSLAKGSSENKEVKILLLGNGSVGKSCFLSRLVKDEFIDAWKSTHGIVIQSYAGDVKRKTQELISPYIYNIWDFAGQDIYHATHRLFMQANALYLVFWDADTKRLPYSEIKERGVKRKYENYSLHYWLHYAEKRGKGSPAILVQTKTGEDPIDPLPGIRKHYENDFLSDIRHIESKATAFEDTHYRELLVSMQNAVRKIKSRSNIPKIWDGVREQVKRLKESGTKYLAYAEFEKLVKGYDEPLEILRWLTQSGAVFFQEEQFDGIILDQMWAIHAIYALFDRNPEDPRKDYYLRIEKNKGQFTGKDLEVYWDTYSAYERELFISFLLSCEMCFEKEENVETPFPERVFIAPQLLPERTAENSEDFWDGRESLHMRYKHDHFHYGIIQSFIARTHFKADTEHLGESRGIWKMGIRLKDHNQYAQVEWLEDPDERSADKRKRLVVRVTENGVPLLNKIRNELEQIQGEEGGALLSADGLHYVDLTELQAAEASNHTHVVDINRKARPIEVFAPFLNRNTTTTFRKKDEERGLEGHFGDMSLHRKGMEREYFAENEPIKILYVSAEPNDLPRIANEYSKIRDQISENIRLGEIEYLPGEFGANFESLLKRLKQDKPNVLHFSGHGTEKGLCLQHESGHTEFMTNDELELMFGGRDTYLRFIFLNSCYSSHQAQFISTQKMYVLGTSDQEIENELASSFAEKFYAGFGAQGPPVDVRRAIKLGCTLFCKSHGEQAEKMISLWMNNGEEINYKQL